MPTVDAETNPLPTEVFSVADKLVKEDPGLKLIHAQIVARLRDENPDADTLTLLSIERIASVYVLIRSKEATGGFAHDRAYKETMAFWHQMVVDMRRSKVKEEAIDEMLAEATGQMVKALANTLAKFDLPDAMRAEIMDTLASSLS